MKTRLILIAAAVAALSQNANAALLDRGNGLIYDTVLNLTWLKDANLAASQTFGVAGIDPDGAMSFASATSWIAALNFNNYKGYNDWRMPGNLALNGSTYVETYTTPGGYTGANDTGYNITNTRAPLANLFYASLGNNGLRDTSGNLRPGNTGGAYGMVNSGPFLNTLDPVSAGGLTGWNFWTGTTASPQAGFPRAWMFVTRSGYQSPFFDDSFAHVWAVRTGDVAAVPEAGTLAMMLTGLALVAGLARRRAG